MSEPTVPETKACSKCGVVKPIEAFYLKRGRKPGARYSTCPECHLALGRAARARKRAALGLPPPARVAWGETRTCSKCGVEKPLADFKKWHTRCRRCFLDHVSVKDRAARLARGGRNITRYASVQDRFWAKVDRSGPVQSHVPELGNCWVWTGARVAGGYGTFTLGVGSQVKAHRMAWTLTHGVIPDGLFACHRCDNAICARPDHLFIGTSKDNAQDCLKKGRANFARGEACARGVLTETLVVAIRAAAKDGESAASIGRRLGIKGSTISAMLRGETWKHVP